MSRYRNSDLEEERTATTDTRTWWKRAVTRTQPSTDIRSAGACELMSQNIQRKETDVESITTRAHGLLEQSIHEPSQLDQRPEEPFPGVEETLRELSKHYVETLYASRSSLAYLQAKLRI